jgi:hypothetical protein
MKKAEYLYGLDVDTRQWLGMTYIDVLHRKCYYAELRIRELMRAHYLWRDYQNISDCFNAIKHNRSLIKEVLE